MSGLTPTGFQIKLLSEILAELQASARATLGADFLTSSDSVGGQVHGIIGDQLRELWEVAAVINSGMRRSTAVGQQLDDIGSLMGVPRLSAYASTVQIRITRALSRAIPITFAVSDPNDPTKIFKINSAVVAGTGVGTYEFTSTTTGPVYANAGTLTKMLDASIAGLTISHLVDAVPGRDIESDADYKLRQEVSLNIQGNGTQGAIRSALMTIAGVTYAAVYVNDTMLTSYDGLPPKSVEAVIRGGLNASILAVLWDKIAFGITTYGNTSGTITDALNNIQTIYFSRPVDVQLYLEAELITVDAQFPGIAYFNQLMIDYIGTIQPGQTIVFTKLYDIAYNCPGLQEVSLSLSKTFGVGNGSNLTFAKRENPVLQSVNCNTGIEGSL